MKEKAVKWAMKIAGVPDIKNIKNIKNPGAHSNIINPNKVGSRQRPSAMNPKGIKPKAQKAFEAAKNLSIGLGSNFAYGAGTGAVAGGLNPLGDDGLIRGAIKGAAVGGLTGAVAGRMTHGSKLGAWTGEMRRKAIDQVGRPGNLVRPAAVVGGVLGGSMGASKRHTVINSNSWSKGTSPMYFNNGRY